MLINNNIFFLVIVCHDLYVKKIDKIVYVGDSAYPFCDVEADLALIEHRTHVEVHASPSREFVRFEKKFFLAFFRQCRPGVLLLNAVIQL